MLKVYNTLGRELQEFRPLREGFVGIYVCGPTVYGHSHIGHAKSYVSFDVIVRYLRYLGHRVRYVQNITDVGHLTDDADMGEDKVGKRAREMGIEPMEVVEMFTRSYFEDMDALNVQRPDISPRASGHVPEQIEMVKALLEKGHAYEVDGNVYFDVTSFPQYGKLSGRSLDEAGEGDRVEAREDKRHPADFALWKRAEPGHLMRWNSPWGVGFPGWHLECSVMSTKYLGETADIHGGGIENIFPHHEDEVAQTEAATGKPFVRYWLHNGMVTVNGQKMGKSLGNFILLKQVFDENGPLGRGFNPLVLRYFVLTSHYRSPLDFSPEALIAAEKGLLYIVNTFRRVRYTAENAAEGSAPAEVTELLGQTKAQFLAEMDNDFNTAGALGVLAIFSRQVNVLLDRGGLSGTALRDVEALYSELAGAQLLDVLEEHPVRYPPLRGLVVGWEHLGTTVRVQTGGSDLLVRTPKALQDAAEGVGARLRRAGLGDLAEQLTSRVRDAASFDEAASAFEDVRSRLREQKNFALADLIRDKLNEFGLQLRDAPSGTT